jgi:hypothetical protein
MRSLSHLPNEQYDQLLSRSLVCLNLFTSVANNATHERIARAPPISVNTLSLHTGRRWTLAESEI